ncbi:MAG TPA: multicopper oxidase domain-containing protein, partial [Vicinamibacteria bacterium]|nr:multicopper oxidase domain-containing protein [Vicinamibacteria bacterium]
MALAPLVLLAALAQEGHPDIYGIDLVPTPDLRYVEGRVTLRHPPSPFGISVSAEGHHRYELDVQLSSLPEPSSLGDYTSYVAWVTTPVMSPLVKLGEVRNGENPALGPIAMNKFVVIVSAEASPDVTAREGRLVLRGTSPSSRIQQDNHLMLPATSSRAAHHGSHWPHPPMHPLLTMIPGLEALSPNVEPFLPRAVPGETIESASPREMISLGDGDTFELVASKVKRTIHGHDYVMYGFNGQYPGPLLEVEQNATITILFRNRIELPTSVHWHGVRLDNRFDGVPGVTQDPVLPGESFEYRVFFKDAGIYWYHPHHREDIQQDLGLYGNMLVRAPAPDFFNEVHREEVLMLDDLLVTGDGIFPYGEGRATHALMGRFGNLMLVNGEPSYRLSVKGGEVVRFFLTNVANTRTFNVSFGGAPIKIVGSDLGKYEREVLADSVVIAPAERYIVEVPFDRAGSFELRNRAQLQEHGFGSFVFEDTVLGRIDVSEERVGRPLPFETLRTHVDVARDLEPFRSSFDRPVDHELLLTLETRGLSPTFMQRLRADRVYFPPVEWSGTMPEMNFPTTSGEVSWILRERATERENLGIDWRFRVGEVAKLRLVNDREAIHAMQHPLHIHGQRFL